MKCSWAPHTRISNLSRNTNRTVMRLKLKASLLMPCVKWDIRSRMDLDSKGSADRSATRSPRFKDKGGIWKAQLQTSGAVTYICTYRCFGTFIYVVDNVRCRCTYKEQVLSCVLGGNLVINLPCPYVSVCTMYIHILVSTSLALNYIAGLLYRVRMRLIPFLRREV